jgi:hypothetical protein
VNVAGKIVEWDALWKLVYSALAAGLGVTLAFSIAVAGVTRFADEMRDARAFRATLFGVMAALGFAVFLAAIVLGVVVMTQKS